MKKLSFILCLLLVCATLCSCSLFRVNPERDGARTVAVVGGEEITKKQVFDAMGIDWDYTVETWEKEDLQSKKQTQLDSLIADTLITQKCKELGCFDFTDEEKAAIDEAYNSFIDPIYKAAVDTLTEQKKEDDTIDIEARANEALDNYLAYYGYTRDSYRSTLELKKANEKLEAIVYKDLTVTDDEIQLQYTGTMQTQQSSYTDGNKVLQGYFTGSTIYYTPVELYYVKDILIALSSETQSEIKALREKEDDKGADEARAKAGEGIKDKADECYAKLTAGGDFDELSDTYNADTSASEFPNGYVTFEGCTSYPDGFTEEALKLKNVGDITSPVLTDNGYHILKLVRVQQQGAMSEEEAYDSIKATITKSKQTQLWNTAQAGWEKDANIKTWYNRLK